MEGVSSVVAEAPSFSLGGRYHMHARNGGTSGWWALGLLAAACSSGSDGGTAPPPPPPPGPATIALHTTGGARFEPAALTVAAGTTVTFTWQDGFHDIVSTGTPTFPGIAVASDPPKQYQFTFTAPGTYQYYCTIHGTPTSGMHGTVIVQ